MPTSFGDLGEGQTGTPLQVDVVGVNKSAEGSEGFAGEEICLSTLFQCQHQSYNL